MIEFDYHVVAFLDILGFSSMVESDSRAKDPRFLPLFIEVFDELSKIGSAGGPKVRMFSDSILVEAVLTPENVAAVMHVSAELQRLFLRRKILIRGGIAHGKHFASENVTFSEALVDAYQIESAQARYPRVVIDHDVLSYAWHHEDCDAKLKDAMKALVRCDRDGANFIDYLSADHFQDLTTHVQSCIDIKKKPSENVLEKMRWLLDYHNHCAKDFSASPLDPAHFRNGFLRFEKIS